LYELHEADNSYLWGVPLHTPFIFLDTETRIIVANQPDADGIFEKQGNLFVGTLPNHLLAAYSFPEIHGKSWAVLPWEMVVLQMEHPEDVLRTMAHMSFHVQQPPLFGDPPGRDNNHANQEFARITIQLEINALIHALKSEGDERSKAIYDALSIRSARREVFSQFIQHENVFEIHEGLADYTETRLLKVETDVLLDRLEAMANSLRHTMNIGGIFGYTSGALYGYLLDEVNIPWREFVDFGTDLAVLLKEAHGITALLSFDGIDLVIYGYDEIMDSETERLENYQRLLDDISDSFKQNPTLRIPVSFENEGMQLNPMNTFQLPGVGMVYGATVVISGVFGRLEVYDGYFARDNTTFDGRVIATDIVIEDNHVSAHGWFLVLEDDYEIKPQQFTDNYVVAKS
jgi:hypothetical protein